jgi:hypothetical protein
MAIGVYAQVVGIAHVTCLEPMCLPIMVCIKHIHCLPIRLYPKLLRHNGFRLSTAVARAVGGQQVGPREHQMRVGLTRVLVVSLETPAPSSQAVVDSVPA